MDHLEAVAAIYDLPIFYCDLSVSYWLIDWFLNT